MVAATEGFEKQGKTGLKWLSKSASVLGMKESSEKRKKAGLEWINKAAAQDYPPALYILSRLYRDGLTSVLMKSQAKANELLLKSANLGFAQANSQLGCFHITGTDGFEQDKAEVYFRTSVAFALDGTITNEKASMTLGICHFGRGYLPEPLPYLAC